MTKKKWQMLTALLLMTVLVVGCGGGKDGLAPEEIVKASYDEMAKMNSYSFDADIQMTMDLGQYGKMDMTMNSKADAINDPLALKMDSKVAITAQGQNQTVDMLQYVLGTDTGMVLYQQIAGQWSQMKIYDPTLVESMKMDPSENMKVYTENMEKVELLGEEKINDRDCHKINVTLSQEAFDKALGNLGSMNSSGVDMDAIKDTLVNMGGLTMTLWIDKENNQMLQESMDLSSVMKEVMASSLKATGASDDDIANLGDCTMTMTVTYSGYNNVNEITVPDEAKTSPDISGLM